MRRGAVQAQDHSPASPQGAHQAHVDLTLLLMTRRRVMDQQTTSQTHRTIEDTSFMIPKNRHESLRALSCPFGSSGRERGQESCIHEEDSTSFIQVKTALAPPCACAQVGACRASAYPGRFQTSCACLRQRRMVLVLISTSYSCFKTWPHKEAVHSAC
jgi:hypothetical protein